MIRLGQTDFARLLVALPGLYSQTDPTDLARAFVELTARLVPCDITTFDEINRETAAFRSINNYPSKDAERYFPAFMAHVHEHPRMIHHAQTGDPSALKISDFIAQGKFRKTGLYNEFYRVFGIRYQLSCFFDGCEPLQVGIGLQSLRRDFTERDRAVLNHLRPHFTQAWKNARLFAKAQQQVAGLNAVTGGLRLGVVALDDQCRIEWTTAYARECLADWFPGGRISGSRLPAILDEWLRRQVRASQELTLVDQRAPLNMAGPGGTGEVRWMPRDGGFWLVLSQGRSRPQVDDLLALGLTRREAEVLSWIMQGKTNPEIAIILSCSANTVRKHIEHILTKLGVETRGAAASRALELMGAF